MILRKVILALTSAYDVLFFFGRVLKISTPKVIKIKSSNSDEASITKDIMGYVAEDNEGGIYPSLEGQTIG